MASKLPLTVQGGAAAWGTIRGSFHSLMALLIAALMLAIIYLARDAEPPPSEEEARVAAEEVGRVNSVGRAGRKGECDLFSGRWVYDNVSYPLYKEKECKFMSDQLACEKYGRKDLSYQHWRWQPHDCDLPRYFHILLSILEFLGHTSPPR
ncbi:hypothetical protein CRG98_049946 [Punica granatum]|uniref:Trichome birefringence-like N-terminal domain-containing protein n=1 Tax=Punica granatum TaxID=22663 RepID=A0A2I0H1I4_PUNGR|nr:hypothetical protein CRG98_049946 [Punica granatum]